MASVVEQVCRPDSKTTMDELRDFLVECAGTNNVPNKPQNAPAMKQHCEQAKAWLASGGGSSSEGISNEPRRMRGYRGVSCASSNGEGSQENTATEVDTTVPEPNDNSSGLRSADNTTPITSPDRVRALPQDGTPSPQNTPSSLGRDTRPLSRKRSLVVTSATDSLTPSKRRRHDQDTPTSHRDTNGNGKDDANPDANETSPERAQVAEHADSALDNDNELDKAQALGCIDTRESSSAVLDRPLPHTAPLASIDPELQRIESIIQLCSQRIVEYRRQKIQAEQDLRSIDLEADQRAIDESKRICNQATSEVEKYEHMAAKISGLVTDFGEHCLQTLKVSLDDAQKKRDEGQSRRNQAMRELEDRERRLQHHTTQRVVLLNCIDTFEEGIGACQKDIDKQGHPKKVILVKQGLRKLLRVNLGSFSEEDLDDMGCMVVQMLGKAKGGKGDADGEIAK